MWRGVEESLSWQRHMLRSIARRPRLATAAGVSTLGLGLDFAFTPKLKLSTVAAGATGTIGTVQV